MKKNICVIFSLILAFGLFAGCSKDKKDVKASSEVDSSKSVSIVTTIFAPYDFARTIVKGTDATVKMLLAPGQEVHSFEPTAQDMIRVQKCDLFIYAGGEGDVWADKIVESQDTKVNYIKMIDCVSVFEEEVKEGMEAEAESEGGHEEEEAEWDEHVWVSPQNAMDIVNKIAESLCSVDPSNAEVYSANALAYVAELKSIDDEIKEVVSSAKRKTVIFADRFPARYFTEEFGLDYYAAFLGCAGDTEPSAATVAFIISKVKEEKIPAVLYIEMSNQKMADIVCESTGCKKLLFNCCHNVSKTDLDQGATYISAMQNNIATLKEALN